MKKVELFNDHFQNFKVYGIPHAQLIIADPPYNLGKNAYASNPAWYKDGDNKNGESELAGKEFFDTDKDFRPAEFMHNHRLVCELQYAQKRFGIEGGSVPNDRKFLTAFNYYTDLLTLNQQREDRVPDHIDAMFQERYGYHFNRD